MSKSTPTTPRLNLAERALEVALEDLDRAEVDLKSAREKSDIARAEHTAASRERDETLLPAAYVVTIRRAAARGGAAIMRERVCVSRRTKATIYTRKLGGEDEQAWRKDKRSEKWYPYPSVRYYGYGLVDKFLEIGDDA